MLELRNAAVSPAIREVLLRSQVVEGLHIVEGLLTPVRHGCLMSAVGRGVVEKTPRSGHSGREKKVRNLELNFV
jgi:hypothetical protein